MGRAEGAGRRQVAAGASRFVHHLEQDPVELARGCHYALRGLVYLAARAHPEEPVLLREIADGIRAPEAFLSKIFQNLRAAGIVRSHRGLSRGYALARDPGAITLYDVILATEGAASLHSSDLQGAEGDAPFTAVWREVEGLVANRLRSTTVKDLAAQPDAGTGAS